MPAHLRWLHERWSKYDSTFFNPAAPAEGVDPNEVANHSRDLTECRKERRQRLLYSSSSVTYPPAPGS